MEQLQGMMSGANTCMSIVMCLCCLSCCAGFVTFIVYLGIYAFANPNLDYVVVDTNGITTLLPAADPALALVPVDNVTEVHANFVSWFLWGFLQAVLPLASALCFFFPPAALCMVGSLQCSGFVWWIMGMVYRFSTAGQYASGDMMPAVGYTEETW